MNREKLLAKARNNPRGLRFTELCALAEAFGYELRRQRGSHRMYRRDDVPERLHFQPDRNNKAKDYQVRQLIDFIDEYGG